MKRARSEQRRSSERKPARGRPFRKGDPRRGPGKPFAPGHSGNPAGRARGLSRFIREETGEGELLATFMLQVFNGKVKKATLRDRIAAATWLADRGFGKPVFQTAGEPERADAGTIVIEEQLGEGEPGVYLYLPDNGRSRALPGSTTPAEGSDA